jgi:hypothetical protein
MTNEIVIDGVMCWLPPIYKDFGIGYALPGELFTFYGFPSRLRTVKVEPIAGEIVNPKKVYEIYKL